MRRSFSSCTFIFCMGLLGAFAYSSQLRAAQSAQKGSVTKATPQFRLDWKKGASPKLPPSVLKKRLRRMKAVTPPQPLKNLPPLTEKERALEKSLDEEIQTLHKLITKYKKFPKRADLYLRQAELFRDKARLVAYRLQEAHNTRYDRWLKSNRYGPEPKLKTEAAQSYNLKAVELYRWFLEDFKKDERVPMALYFLGYNYVDAGQAEKGRQALQQVIDQHPKSPFARMAGFQLAEYHFEEHQWDKAKSFYVSELTGKKGENYLFALYKYAWCQYYLRDQAKALKNMKIVFQRSLQKTRRSSANRFHQRIWEEAKRAVVFFYAEAGNYQKALEEFQHLAKGEEYERLLEQLAELYTERADDQKAAFIYSSLLKTNPSSAKAPYYAYEIIAQYDGWEKPQDYHVRLLKWARAYDKESEWGAKNGSELKAVEEFQEAKLRVWCLHNHQAMKTKATTDSVKRTFQAYRVYLNRFSETKHSDEMRYFYADLLFDRGAYKSAADQYLWLAKKNTAVPGKKESLFGAMLALEKNMPSDEEIQKSVQGTTEPVPFPPPVEKFVSAAGMFVESFPKAKENLEINYRLSRLFYLYNHFSEAEKGFEGIIKNHPKTEFAEYSANLLLDIYKLKKDYAGFIRVGGNLAQQEAFRKTKMANDIGEMVEQAAFKQATEENTSQAFLDFVKSYPKSVLVGKAHFNAAVILKKEHQVQPAIAQFNKSVSVSTEPSIVEQSHQALIDLYERLGDYQATALEYELAGKTAADNKKAETYFYNAAVLWTALGEGKKAEASLQKLSPESLSKKKVAMEGVATLYREQKNFSSSNRIYERLLSDFSQDTDRCLWLKEMAENEYRRGKAAASLDMRNRAEKCINDLASSDVKKMVGAKAWLVFHQALDIYGQLLTFPRGKGAAEQEKILSDKLGLLNQLEKKLSDVIALNVTEYIVSGLAIGGEAYRFMGDFISSSPVPSGLSAEELQQYKEGVEKYAAQMKESSEKYARLAKDKAQSFQWTTDWLERVSAGTSFFRQDRMTLRVHDEM